jgi:hypothetical protein
MKWVGNQSPAFALLLYLGSHVLAAIGFVFFHHSVKKGGEGIKIEIRLDS